MITGVMNKQSPFLRGMRDGIPIALGYYAVSFSLGIIASKAGLFWWMGFISSLLTRASAGEYGGYTLAAVGATYAELVAMCLVTNIRYLLMSTALTQKFRAGTSLLKRSLVSLCITDEVFGISIAYPGYLAPTYTLGATLVAGFCWAAGTASGIIAGDILPVGAVSALSVALYGMFIAIIIPPAKHDRAVMWAVIASFVSSGVWAELPKYVTLPESLNLSSGTRTILLTLLISAVVAIIKPVREKAQIHNSADHE